jgi:hypothetical protein
MATDQELITQTVYGYFEGWYDAVVARMDRALHPDLEYLHLIRTGGRWTIVDALWLPQ